MGRLNTRTVETISKSKIKKSVRLMIRDYNKTQEKRVKNNYIWPRTVEAAVDPFADNSGKNKMLFMIGCGLFPFSKIVVPDSESDDEQETYSDVSNNETSHHSSRNARETSGSSTSTSEENFKNLTRRRASKSTKRRRTSETDEDPSWRSQYGSRRPNTGTTKRGKLRIDDEDLIQDVINTVIRKYQWNEFDTSVPMLPLPPLPEVFNPQ